MRSGYSNRFHRISPANLPAEQETPHVVSRTQGSDGKTYVRNKTKMASSSACKSAPSMRAKVASWYAQFMHGLKIERPFRALDPKT